MLARRTTVYDFLSNRNQRKRLNLFTVAVTVVCTGLMLGAAVKGNTLISNLQYQGFYEELRSMEDRAWSFKSQLSYWPGDCDRDGIIGHQPQNRLSDQLSVNNYPSREHYQISDSCIGIKKLESVNASFSDMRRAGFLDLRQSNEDVSSHQLGGIFQFGHSLIGQNNEPANVIVAYGVPVSIARSIDSAMDGKVDGEHGRVRRFDEQAGGSQWPGIGNQQTVTLAYYFDQKLPQ